MGIEEKNKGNLILLYKSSDSVIVCVCAYGLINMKNYAYCRGRRVNDISSANRGDFLINFNIALVTNSTDVFVVLH